MAMQLARHGDGSFAVELNAALGPLRAAPLTGVAPLASAAPLRLPLGSALINLPYPVCMVMVQYPI